MNLQQNLQQAFANLFSAKLRSFLAILGILVGTAAVVALLLIGESVSQKVIDQFKSLGTDLMAVSVYQTKPSAAANSDNTLHLQDVTAMPKYIPAITKLAPYTMLFAPVIFAGKKFNSGIAGVTDELQTILKINIAKGRFISFADTIQPYCVIGHDLDEEIKNKTHIDPYMQQLKLGHEYFTVIGVMYKWQQSMFFNVNVNRSILIPIRSSLLITTNAPVNNMVMKLKPNSNIDAVKKSITGYIKKVAPDLKLFVRSAKQIIESLGKQTQTLNIFLGVIGGISLLVGGIGVMNVMLVSVTERRREIGIRKALGARNKDIQLLFLFESIVLALFGGICGIVVGIIASYITSYFAHWPMQFFLAPPLLGFFVSGFTGVFFGFYPAYRASRLTPIETLRYD